MQALTKDIGALLGLQSPWEVMQVTLDLESMECRIEVVCRTVDGLACPKCGAKCSGYDHSRRQLRHLDMCEYRKIVVAEVPRMRCEKHGVQTLQVPWAEPKSQYTKAFESWVIKWLQEASVSAVARMIGLSWSAIDRIMQRAVTRGLARRADLEVTRIGVDETYVQADETTMPVQDRTKNGETHRCYYWTYLALDAGLVAVDYCTSRARAGPVAFLEGFEGALQTDGYKAYDGFEAESLITTYGCMAHARRYFYDCLKTDPVEAPYVVGLFRELYAIERGLRKINACAETRMKARQKEAKPILDKLEKWMKEKKVLPSSKLAVAINYSLNRWDKLTRYVDNGRIEMDNNLVENALRPFALGRKNYLFAGSHKAAQRAAVLYSLLGTCKLQGIDPQKWLTDVLDRLATHPAKRASELLPHNWKKAQKPTLKKAA